MRKLISLLLVVVVMTGVLAPLSFSTLNSKQQLSLSVAFADDAGDIEFAAERDGRHMGLCIYPTYGSMVNFFGLDIKNCLKILLYYVLQILAYLVALAGKLFDAILKATIVDLKQWIDQLRIVNVSWTAFRDVANMFFIFILLYVAIMTILKGTGVLKSRLPAILITALLINFSLFFTKVVIDISNITTIQFYNEAFGGRDPSVIFMNAFALQQGYQSKYINDDSYYRRAVYGDEDGYVAIELSDANHFAIDFELPTIFMMIIMFVVVAMVFLAVCILYIIRFVVFIFCMILSPLAFIGGIIPQLKSALTNRWQKSLFNNAIFGPTFMIMMWVVVQIMQNPEYRRAVGMGAVGSFKELNNDVPSTFVIVLNFIILIAFIIAALIISKSVGVEGAGTAINTFNKMRGATTSFIGRNTVGRGARAAGAAYDKAAAKGRQALTFVGNKAAAVQSKVASAVGARASQAAGAARGKWGQILASNPRLAAAQARAAATANRVKNSRAGRVAGRVVRPVARAGAAVGTMGLSEAAIAAARAAKNPTKTVKAATGSILGFVDRTIKGALTAAEKSKYGGSKNLAEQEKEIQDRSRELDTVEAQMERGRKVEAGLDSNDPAVLKEMYEAVSKMSKDEVINQDISIILNSKVASALSADQLKHIMDSGNFSQAQKDDIKKARKEGIVSRINADPKEARAIFKGSAEGVADMFKDVIGKSADDYNKLTTSGANPLSNEAFRAIVYSLDANALKKMADKGEIADTLRDIIRDAIETRLDSDVEALVGKDRVAGTKKAETWLNKNEDIF